MIRYLACTFLFLFAVLPVIGQPINRLDDQQAKVYKKSSLNIDLPGLQVTSSSGNDYQLSCSLCWTPYRGYERLDEPSFFEIAGQEQLAKEARRSKRNKFIAMGLGGLSMVAGATIISNNMSQHRAGNMQAGLPVFGVLLVGAGGATVGFSAMKLHNRSIPYEIAQDVALEYNNQLLDELANGQE